MQNASVSVASTATSTNAIALMPDADNCTVAPPESPSPPKRSVAKPAPRAVAPNRTNGGGELPSVLYRALTYRCHFCMNPLQSGPKGLTKFFWAMFSLRVGYCPHCFVVRTHPIGPLKLLLLPFRMLYIAFLDAEDS